MSKKPQKLNPVMVSSDTWITKDFAAAHIHELLLTSAAAGVGGVFRYKKKQLGNLWF